MLTIQKDMLGLQCFTAVYSKTDRQIALQVCTSTQTDRLTVRLKVGHQKRNCLSLSSSDTFQTEENFVRKPQNRVGNLTFYRFFKKI